MAPSASLLLLMLGCSSCEAVADLNDKEPWTASFDASACTKCGARCVDIDADPLACGSCSKSCDSTQYCDGTGTCACRPGLDLCNGRCVDTQSDRANCGDCGQDCPSWRLCSAGKCDWSCSTGSSCDGACVDKSKSPTNCGSCGKTCATNELCVDSGCRAYAPAVGCTSCPCSACATGTTCCPALAGQLRPICVNGTKCP